MSTGFRQVFGLLIDPKTEELSFLLLRLLLLQTRQTDKDVQSREGRGVVQDDVVWEVVLLVVSSCAFCLNEDRKMRRTRKRRGEGRGEWGGRRRGRGGGIVRGRGGGCG